MKITYSNSSIGSIEALAKTLDVSEGYLTRVARDPEEFYSLSELPKKSGGVRTISDPVKELKIIQRRIIRRIFSKCLFPNYLFGSIKDDDNPRDFVRNAKHHVDACEVMAFDIESFFPSTHPGHVKKVFKYLLNLPDEVANLLVSLTTLNNGLPQGAPTSPYIANLIFYDTEHKLVKTLMAKGFTYSRLVDDITVSSKKTISHDERSFIYTSIRNLLIEKRFKICERKYAVTNTEVVGRKTVVTGLVVERKSVKLPKETVKRIGGMIYTLKCQAEVDTTNQDYHKQYGTVSGLVSLYTRLNENKSKNYRLSLQKIKPTYSKEKEKKIRSLCRKFISYAKSHPARLAEEGYAKKYYLFKHKLSILKRTNRASAVELEKELHPLKPLYLLSSYHE